MADQHQGQDQLPQPSLGDRQVEEDLVGRCWSGGEGLAESLLGGMNLLREELPADLMLPSQLGDRFRAGEYLDGQVLPLLSRQLLGRTQDVISYRSGPANGVGGRRGITLRDRDKRTRVAIPVCFLRETGFVRFNHPQHGGGRHFRKGESIGLLLPRFEPGPVFNHPPAEEWADRIGPPTVARRGANGVCATPGENRSVRTHSHATGREMWCAPCAHHSLSTNIAQFPGNRNAYAGDSAVRVV
jgi:hypothetical protein